MKAVRDWPIRWKVAAHLLVILLLVLVNLGGVWLFLQEQEHDGTAINEAGKQRLLVQQMRLEAHLVGMGQQGQRADLAADAAEFDRSLRALSLGNETLGVPAAPPSVSARLEAVQAEWEPYFGHVQKMLETSPTTEEFNTSLSYIEAHSDELLAASDQVVQQYEQAFERKVSWLQWFLIGIFFVDIFVIVILYVFIDRHLLQRINRLTEDADVVARGNTEYPITVVNAADEIGNLTRSLEEMKANLVSALREATRYEQAVEHAGHAIYITDPTGIIQYVNPAFEEITKFSETEAIGEDPAILQSGRQQDAYYQDLWDTISSGETWNEELVNEKATGELFHAYQTIAPITDDNGEIDGYVAILADRTEEIVSSQQNQVLNRVLRHNLRTELNLIKGYAHELASADNTTKREKFMEKIGTHVDSLVDMSSKAERSIREIDQTTRSESRGIRAACEYICAAMEQQYPEATVECEFPSYEIDVLTNIELILEELVDNAITHNDSDNPRVMVRASLEEDSDHPPTVRIEVADNGPGIPQSERLVIEEGEETPLFHGSGLGLWSVHWSVMRAGGDVSIQDRDARGTTVVLALPRASVTPFPRDSEEDATGSVDPEDLTIHENNQQ